MYCTIRNMTFFFWKKKTNSSSENSSMRHDTGKLKTQSKPEKKRKKRENSTNLPYWKSKKRSKQQKSWRNKQNANDQAYARTHVRSEKSGLFPPGAEARLRHKTGTGKPVPGRPGRKTPPNRRNAAATESTNLGAGNDPVLLLQRRG